MAKTESTKSPPSAPAAGTADAGCRYRIIVPTHKRPRDLKRFLEALGPLLATRPEFKLVVVNDGSHDGDYQAVIDGFAGEMTYIALAENLGISSARAAGLPGADEDYIVSTDDDCVPGPLWLDRIAALTKAHPGADIIAGFTEPVARRPGWFRKLWNRLPNASPESSVDNLGLVTAVTANAVYRRPFFLFGGPLDLDLQFAPDDYHVTQTALRNGASFRVEEGFLTGHMERENFRSYLKAQYRYGLAAAEYAVAFADQRLVGLFGEATVRQMVEKCRAGARRQWDAANQDGRRLPTRMLMAGLGGLGSTALQFGWFLGAKRYQRRLGKTLPEIQKLREQFQDFCVEVDSDMRRTPAGID